MDKEIINDVFDTIRKLKNNDCNNENKKYLISKLKFIVKFKDTKKVFTDFFINNLQKFIERKEMELQ